MRRQLKLQGQLSRPPLNPDRPGSEAARGALRLQADASDGQRCEGQRENGRPASAHARPAARRSEEGPSPEELRSSSIAALRAKAREHEAEIHNTVNASGGDAQTQEAAARLED